MSWQDVTILISEVFFAIALFPSIMSKDKPALITSVLNAFFLVVLAFTNYTLNLYGATVGFIVVGGLWFVLAVQKYLIDKRNK